MARDHSREINLSDPCNIVVARATSLAILSSQAQSSDPRKIVVARAASLTTSLSRAQYLQASQHRAFIVNHGEGCTMKYVSEEVRQQFVLSQHKNTGSTSGPSQNKNHKSATATYKHKWDIGMLQYENKPYCDAPPFLTLFLWDCCALVFWP